MKFLKVPYWPLLVGPFLSYGFGFALNALVMALNHSSMPVHMPVGLEVDPEDWIHSAMTTATHLKFLADWIVIRGSGIASPGDFLIWAGDWAHIPAFFVWLTLMVKDHNENAQ